tara:strand:- start:118 stop:600 length:483 start_codon:yes stop_codon:yes gene_type:complete
MKYLKISLGIFLVLASSRLIPHPPNFTNLIALSFYVPAILGLRYIPALLIAFILTDLIIGYHTGTHWTWGSVFIIGLISKYFNKNISLRLTGALTGALIFFLITNFGVWTTGMYGYTVDGLFSCFVLAVPFFVYNLISTSAYSLVIEGLYKFYRIKFLKV